MSLTNQLNVSPKHFQEILETLTVIKATLERRLGNCYLDRISEIKL